MRDETRLIDELAPLVGVERTLHEVHHALKVAVRSRRFPVVGALHVTCSDETQFETVEAFHKRFARDLLPRLKFAHRSPMHTSNLGGCFEWDSLRIAEAHFADAARDGEPILVVVKISSHVGVEDSAGHRRFGSLRRYGSESSSCGALAAVLADAEHPRGRPLREALRSEGVDRLELLRRYEPADRRLLAAALVSARLQARSATLEAQDLEPRGPAIFLIVAAATLNQPTRDHEVVTGLYLVDRREGQGRAWYRGLGDRPDRYRIRDQHGRLRVDDESGEATRPARDHRMKVDEARRAALPPLVKTDPRIEEVLARARRSAHAEPHLVRGLLKTALAALAEATPVPAALLLFSQGAAGIYHAYRAHHLVENVAASGEARELLADLHQQVDRLPPEKARQVLEVLVSEYDRF